MLEDSELEVMVPELSRQSQSIIYMAGLIADRAESVDALIDAYSNTCSAVARDLHGELLDGNEDVREEFDSNMITVFLLECIKIKLMEEKLPASDVIPFPTLN